MLNTLLLFVAGWWQRLIGSNLPAPQSPISLQVATLQFPSPVGQLGGVDSFSTQQRSDLSWSRTRIRFLDDRPLVLDAVNSPLRTRYYLRLYISRFRLLHHLFTHSLLALLNPISSEDGCLIDVGREGAWFFRRLDAAHATAIED